MATVKLPLSFISYSSPQVGANIEKITKAISSLASNDVLIKVSYSSINPMDAYLRNNNIFNLPLPLTLGFDFSGIIVAMGNDADGTYSDDGLSIGDDVLGVTGPLNGGAFAEYVVVKRHRVAKKGSIPFKEAAAYGVAYATAYEGLCREDNVNKRKGQSVYIPGGCGGVGHFGVQLAKQAGMIVFASGSKPESLKLANKLGVDHYIDYKKQDVVKEILSLTNNRGVDLVWDATYRVPSFLQSASVVANGGRWVRLGGALDATEAINIAKNRGADIGMSDLGRYSMTEPYISRGRSLLSEAFTNVLKYYEMGTVRAHVSLVIPADPAALQKALGDIGTGQGTVGKMVFEVNPSL